MDMQLRSSKREERAQRSSSVSTTSSSRSPSPQQVHTQLTRFSPVSRSIMSDQQIQTDPDRVAELLSSILALIQRIPTQPTAVQQKDNFDLEGAVNFIRAKYLTRRNRRDQIEARWLLYAWPRLAEMDIEERSFFIERTKMLAVAMRFGWRTAIANAPYLSDTWGLTLK